MRTYEQALELAVEHGAPFYGERQTVRGDERGLP